MKNLLDTYVALGPGFASTEVPVSPGVFEELDRRFDGFRGHQLVSAFRFESDWPTWEMHPAGDEVVVLVSGSAEMVLDQGGRPASTRLSAPGEYVIVPRGTWHTARISQPTMLLFVTPGEGTANAPVGSRPAA